MEQVTVAGERAQAPKCSPQRTAVEPPGRQRHLRRAKAAGNHRVACRHRQVGQAQRRAAAIEHRKGLLRHATRERRAELTIVCTLLGEVGSTTGSVALPVPACTMIAGPLAGTGSRRTASAITFPLAPLLERRDRQRTRGRLGTRPTPARSSCRRSLPPATVAG